MSTNSENFETWKWNILTQNINKLLNEIEKEYKFRENTLENLLSFKFKKWKEHLTRISSEYRNNLLQEIKKQADLWQILTQSDENIWGEQFELLADKLMKITKLREQISGDIQALREDIHYTLYDTELFSPESFTFNWSKKTLERIENPNWFIDQTLGLWVWIIETGAIIWKFWYHIITSILKAPFHGAELARGKVTLETNIKI